MKSFKQLRSCIVLMNASNQQDMDCHSMQRLRSYIMHYQGEVIKYWPGKDILFRGVRPKWTRFDKRGGGGQKSRFWVDVFRGWSLRVQSQVYS